MNPYAACAALLTLLDDLQERAPYTLTQDLRREIVNVARANDTLWSALIRPYPERVERYKKHYAFLVTNEDEQLELFPEE